MLKTTALEYFSAFRSKDLKRLHSTFAKEVTLRDWSLFEAGRENVLNANAKIFEALDDIRLDIINMYESDRTVVAELTITATNLPLTKVVDILAFDDDGKIKSVRAYKG